MWIYEVVKLPYDYHNLSEKEILKEMGQNGWELVQIVWDDGHPRMAYFKQKQEQKEVSSAYDVARAVPRGYR